MHLRGGSCLVRFVLLKLRVVPKRGNIGPQLLWRTVQHVHEDRNRFMHRRRTCMSDSSIAAMSSRYSSLSSRHMSASPDEPPAGLGELGPAHIDASAEMMLWQSAGNCGDMPRIAERSSDRWSLARCTQRRRSSCRRARWSLLEPKECVAIAAPEKARQGRRVCSPV